jgi:hypothetical protein
MTTSILKNKDVLGGCLLIVIGAAAAMIARNYAFGTPRQMGPGFLPMMLAFVLMALGLAIAIKGTKDGGTLEGLGSLRPVLIVLGGVLVFSQTLERLGLVLSSFILVLITCLAHRPFKIGEALMLSVGLTIGVVLLFAYALGVPFSLWPWSV